MACVQRKDDTDEEKRKGKLLKAKIERMQKKRGSTLAKVKDHWHQTLTLLETTTTTKKTLTLLTPPSILTLPFNPTETTMMTNKKYSTTKTKKKKKEQVPDKDKPKVKLKLKRLDPKGDDEFDNDDDGQPPL